MADSNSIESTFKLLRDQAFKGYSFILPSVSVGNVGQLAVDLILSSLTAVKVGYVLHPAILPVVGSDPYDLQSSSFMIGCEIFAVENLKLLFMQIRSPLIKQLRNDFLLKLVKWIQKMECAEVIMLTSSYEYERSDEQIRGTPLRYLMTANLFSKHEERIAQLGWKELEKRRCADITTLGSSIGEKLCIPGGGFAKVLFDMCTKQEISSAILLKFCSEGDNIPDSVLLADYWNDLVRIVPQTISGDRWRFPPSWKHLFGNAPVEELY
ncbi:hypothetical protein PR048_017427 [Dryococelus australis]|uniref:Proteasome assembly chaperone 2 n=1 Tax=Dryococelus australis TaxID=614101 RepID=A0ABQ9H9I6_9NEOP|nr:hypothetical protein PR048_017427 [Dryococelus australis]